MGPKKRPRLSDHQLVVKEEAAAIAARVREKEEDEAPLSRIWRREGVRRALLEGGPVDRGLEVVQKSRAKVDGGLEVVQKSRAAGQQGDEA